MERARGRSPAGRCPRRAAPSSPFAELATFLTRFTEAYRTSGGLAVRHIVALAASHHRLMWIHPFSEGNGRVTRLFSAAYAERIGLGGLGVWTISRGLARHREEYMRHLAAGDEPRRNGYDGRGALPEAALREFCELFLNVCLDQIDYMAKLLSLESFGERLVGYAALRASHTALGPDRTSDRAFRVEAGHLLRAVMLRGTLPRGEAPNIMGVGRTIAGSTIKELLREGLLHSLTQPPHSVGRNRTQTAPPLRSRLTWLAVRTE